MLDPASTTTNGALSRSDIHRERRETMDGKVIRGYPEGAPEVGKNDLK